MPEMPAAETAPTDSPPALSPFLCSNCAGSLPVPDADRARCPSCGADNAVPEEHRKARALLRDADRELSEAADAWRRVDRGTVSVWLVALFALAAPLLLIGGQIWIFTQIGDTADPIRLAHHLALYIWLPSLPGFTIGLVVLLMGVGGKHAEFARSAMSAVPPSQPGQPACCRVCKAPLDVPPNALFVRCLYCRADSLTSFSKSTSEVLESERSKGALNVKRALTLLQDRAQLAQGVAVLAPIFQCLLLALPLWWAFGDNSWLRQDNNWQFAYVPAIVLNLFVLFVLNLLSGLNEKDLIGEASDTSTLKGMLFSGALVASVALAYFDFRIMDWVASHH